MSVIDSISAGAASSQTHKAPELGQEDFLKLLVAQLKNQDPSNPMDNAEFLGQIAQFSMVSGIDDLQGSFNSVAGSLYGSQAMQASTLVGREVLAETGAGWLEEGGVMHGLVELPGAGEGVQIQISDAAGRLVDVIELSSAQAGRQAFAWNGVDAEGNALPAGRYNLQAVASVNGELQAVPVHLYTRVESVSVDRASTSIRLHLAGGESAGLSQVSEYK